MSAQQAIQRRWSKAQTLSVATMAAPFCGEYVEGRDLDHACSEYERVTGVAIKTNRKRNFLATGLRMHGPATIPLLRKLYLEGGGSEVNLLGRLRAHSVESAGATAPELRVPDALRRRPDESHAPSHFLEARHLAAEWGGCGCPDLETGGPYRALHLAVKHVDGPRDGCDTSSPRVPRNRSGRGLPIALGRTSTPGDSGAGEPDATCVRAPEDVGRHADGLEREPASHPDLTAVVAILDCEVRWRADAMRPQVPTTGAIPCLRARPGPLWEPGQCHSCTNELGPTERYRCRLCVAAINAVLDNAA